jgi:transcriptional regulator with GAF, ATPase, and Fis domain
MRSTEYDARAEESSELLHQMTEALRYMPDAKRTWDEILRVMMNVTRGENCSLMLKSVEAEKLVIRAARGRRDLDLHMGRNLFRKSFPQGGGVAGWVLETGCGVYLSNVGKDPRFIEVEESPFKIGSLMCFPVRDGNQTVGILNLSHGDEAAFGDQEEQAMKMVSSQLSIILTSARMGENNHSRANETHPSGQSQTLKSMDGHKRRACQLVIPPHNGNSGDGHLLFLYKSPKMLKIVETINQVADTDVTVLIQGESGVGKELVARALHYQSGRKNKPFIKVNCAALPEELLESELFGYEKGAFTGAYNRKPGKFELAHGGTILLDEIAEISPSLQAKLLQVLQDGEFARLGGKRDIQVDVRVLVATNRNLAEYVKDGRFREDLYYRLNVLNIYVPPLRERKEEIHLLIEYLLEKNGRKYGESVPSLSQETTDLLISYHWPGNVRELENMIKRFVVLGNEEVIERELSSSLSAASPLEVTPEKTEGPKPVSLKEISRKAALEAEAEVIVKTLEQTRWNRKKAAKLLGISYKALLYKIKESGLDRTPVADMNL